MSKNKLKVPRKIKRLTADRLRLSIKKSNKEIFAQVIDDKISQTVASASSLKIANENKTKQAQEVGKNLASILKKKSIVNIYFDRTGKYVGRLKVLCETLRENGINF